jgi:hypothetical protein
MGMHGDKEQKERDFVLGEFKKGCVYTLMCMYYHAYTRSRADAIGT